MHETLPKDILNPFTEWIISPVSKGFELMPLGFSGLFYWLFVLGSLIGYSYFYFKTDHSKVLKTIAFILLLFYSSLLFLATILHLTFSGDGPWSNLEF
jgi:lipid-A-disaccharide synthase-like uncharacterized protein